MFPFDFPQSSMKCTTSPYLNDGCPVNTTQGVLKQLLNPSAKITLYETDDVHRHSHPNGLCIDQFEALTRPLPPPGSPTGGGEYKILNVKSLLSNGLERQFHIVEEWCIEAKNPKATPKTNTWLCKILQHSVITQRTVQYWVGQLNAM